MTIKKPIGALATIQWKDTNEVHHGYYFSFGSYDEDHEDADHGVDSNGVPDMDIFFYVDDEDHLKEYKQRGKDDFFVIHYDLVYENE
jgi:hypothetical protein